MKLLISCTFSLCTSLFATGYGQQLLQTGGKEMPDEWIDKDTHHKVVKLTRNDRSNFSFYFHNNPFVGNDMIFYSTTKAAPTTNSQETYNIYTKDKQLFIINLKTLKADRLTNHPIGMNGRLFLQK